MLYWKQYKFYWSGSEGLFISPQAAQSTDSSLRQRRNFSPSAGLLASCVCSSAPEQMGSRRHVADDPANACVRDDMNTRSNGTSARRFRSLTPDLNVMFFYVTLLEKSLGGFEGFISFLSRISKYLFDVRIISCILKNSSHTWYDKTSVCWLMRLHIFIWATASRSTTSHLHLAAFVTVQLLIKFFFLLFFFCR